MAFLILVIVSDRLDDGKVGARESAQSLEWLRSQPKGHDLRPIVGIDSFQGKIPIAESSLRRKAGKRECAIEKPIDAVAGERMTRPPWNPRLSDSWTPVEFGNHKS